MAKLPRSGHKYSIPYLVTVYQSKGYSNSPMPAAKEVGPSRADGTDQEDRCIHNCIH